MASVFVAAAVVVGLPRDWAPMKRTAWAAALGVAAIFLLVNAFSGLTDVAFPRRTPRRPPTALQRGGVFLGSTAVVLSAAIWIIRWYGVPAVPAFVGAWGAFYLVASTGRPWLLFATIRERGTLGLGFISSERYARLMLASLGLLAIGATLLIR